MREQLIQYVNLLFAGAPDSDDIKQEILQNTLDRFDDLISQGKTPEGAYRLAITGIGDINEILGNSAPLSIPRPANPVPAAENDTPVRKVMRAVAVALYIICALPLIVLSDLGMDSLGLCGTLAIVAVATVLIILGKKPESEEECSRIISENIWISERAESFIFFWIPLLNRYFNRSSTSSQLSSMLPFSLPTTDTN